MHIGDDILMYQAKGTLKEHHIEKLFEQHVKVIKQSGLAEKGYHYEIANWEKLGNSTWRARKMFIDRFKKSNQKYPCKLYVIWGLNKFLHTVVRISRQFFPVPLVIAEDLEHAVCIINRRKEGKTITSDMIKENEEIKKTFTGIEVKNHINNLLKFMGKINWDLEGINVNEKEIIDSQIFKPLYESISLIKQDFDMILKEKNKAEKEIKEQNRFNKLRIDIWKLAADKSLTEEVLIQKLLNKVGPVLGVSRACFNKFTKENPYKSDLRTVIEWCDKGVKPSIKTIIPTKLVKHFIQKEAFLLSVETAIEKTPELLRPVLKPIISFIAKTQNLKSMFIEPYYINEKMEGMFSFEICKDKKGKPEWSDELKGIVKDAVSIVSNHVAQKRAEQALHNNEEKYRTIFEGAHDIIVFVNRSGKILEVNRKVKEIFGLERDEVIGKNFARLKLFKLKDVPKILKLFKGIVKRGKVKDTTGKDINVIELVMNGKNGKEIFIEASTTIVRKNGKFIGFLSILRDITERRSTEKSLLKQLAYEQMLFSIASNAVKTKNLNDFQDKCLSIMANILDVSRIYIFKHDYLTDRMDNTFEWVASGITPQKDNLQGVPASLVPWWMDRVKKNMIIKYNDIENISDKQVKKILKSQQVKSILVVPLFLAGKYYGFIGFDKCRYKRIWEIEDIRLLQTVAHIITGVIEHGQAEEKTKESEERYRTLFESAAEGILIAAIKTKKFKYANPAICKMLGYKEEELKKMSVCDIHPENASENIISEFRKQTKGIKKLSPDIACLRKDGKIIFININTTKVILDGKEFIVGFLRDITKRKKLEDELRNYTRNLEKTVHERTKTIAEEKEKIDGIIKSMADGLLVTDIHDKILLINPYFELITGLKSENTVNHKIWDKIKNDKLKRIIKKTLRKRQSGYIIDFEIEDPIEKTTKILQARTSVVKDKSGKIFAIVTIFHDITREREIDRLKSDFISTAAHELRTPLTTIQGFSEILMMRENLPEKRKQLFLKLINNESIHLSSIISDLLDISRIESGKELDFNKENLNVKEIVNKIVIPFKETSQKHEFIAHYSHNIKNCFICGDEEKITQVINNILSNAVKYSPVGGRIIISAKEILDRIEISIKDEGMGIAKKHLPYIFNKFYRIDNSLTRKIDGTGLGLSIAEHIIRQHDGNIKVDSEFNKGSNFIITLPAVSEKLLNT